MVYRESGRILCSIHFNPSCAVLYHSLGKTHHVKSQHFRCYILCPCSSDSLTPGSVLILDSITSLMAGRYE